MTTKESVTLANIIHGYKEDIKKRESLIQSARTVETKGILSRENLILSQVIHRLERFQRSGT